MDHIVFLASMLLFGLSMCFTPGPNNAIAMATGLDKGFRAALPFCLGSAVGANISLVLLGVGLARAFALYPVLYDILRWSGAVYMVWLAWRISGLPFPGFWKMFVRGGNGGNEVGKAPLAKAGERRGMEPFSFLQGCFFQLLNVKVWITNIVLVSTYIGAGEAAAARLPMTVGLFTIMGFTAMSLWAASGMAMGRFLTSGGMRRANYLFASFLLFSVVLLFV